MFGRQGIYHNFPTNPTLSIDTTSHMFPLQVSRDIVGVCHCLHDTYLTDPHDRVTLAAPITKDPYLLARIGGKVG